MKWEKIFGTNYTDDLTPPNRISFVDRDGKYLIACTSNSVTGDFSGNHSPGGYPTSDIWIAKLDSQTNKIWSVSLGGTANDYFGSLQLAHDSGYIVAGSASSIDGNVTGNHGSSDAWVIRLGSQGNIVWKKCYGGTGNDGATYVERTGDGYILLGNTNSNDGDISGLHGTAGDIWVARLDKNGGIVWQKCLGGSNIEQTSAIKQTSDGGYIITGSTYSMDGDVQGAHGNNGGTRAKSDLWVVKLDQNGSIEWQKCLGGTGNEFGYDIELTPAGGYLVSGSANSVGGDVTGYHGWDTAENANDAWVVSLTSSGTINWQKCFGGKRKDGLYDIQILPDQSFIGVGETESKDGDVSYVNGIESDCWLVNFNSSGNIIWEKTFGTTALDYGVALSVANNGNIVIAGFRQLQWHDVWMLEVGAVNTIAGYVFYDTNSDGIKNNGESLFDKVTIRAGKNGDTTSAIPKNGYYTMDVDTGIYSTKAIPYSNYYTVSPAAKTSTFNSYFNTDSIHFAVKPLPGIRDVTISMFPLTVARPGFTTQYRLVYKNVGTNPVGAGFIKLIKDRRLSVSSTVPVTTSVNNDTLIWNYNNLAPNAETTIVLNFTVGIMPSVNLGDTLKSIAWINQDAIDLTPTDDTATLKQIVIGSFDPNDKTEANAGIITPAQVSNGEYLNYVIRFQNTGTDTAFNVTVRDTLENRLDWNSLQMISASHAYQLSIENGNKLTWQFSNIKLPYDEPNSHGYIAYRIKPKSTVLAGDTIKNTAGIYFDYNLPVATNTEKTVVFLLTPLPVTLLSFQAALDGEVVNVTWTTSQEEQLKNYEIQRSANGVDFITIGTVLPGKTAYLVKDKQPAAGYNYYRLRSVDMDGSDSYSTMVLVNVKNGADIISSLYPNPATGHATLKLQGSVNGNVSVQVLDLQGRLVTTRQFGVQHTGEFKTPLDLGSLSKGSYVLRITVNDKTYLHKLLIQ